MTNSDSVTIRSAIPMDANGIAALFRVLGHEVTTESIEAQWNEEGFERNRALVAQSSTGQVIGLITISSSRVIHRDVPVGHITALVVDPDFRGQGIGKRLLTTAEQELFSGGCLRIELVSNNRYADAHPFYEHLGYEATGIRLQKTNESTS